MEVSKLERQLAKKELEAQVIDKSTFSAIFRQSVKVEQLIMRKMTRTRNLL